MSFLRKLIDNRTYKTMFGEARCFITCDSLGNYVRVFSLDGTYQSATYLDDMWDSPPFAYILAFDSMFQAQEDGLEIKDVLMLGGGCFSYSKHFLTHTDNTHMDVVEIDPEVIKIAHKHFYLDKLEKYLECREESERLNIFIQDGYEFLANTKKRYSVIINDSFEGNRASEIFQAPNTIELIKEHLQPKGLYMTNIVADLATTGVTKLLNFKTVLESTFSHTHIIDANDEEFGGADNYIVIGTDGEYTFANSVDFD